MGRWRAYRAPVNRIHACLCGFGRQFHQRNIHSYSRDSSYIHVYVKFLLLADFLASETGTRVLASELGNAFLASEIGIRDRHQRLAPKFGIRRTRVPNSNVGTRVVSHLALWLALAIGLLAWWPLAVLGTRIICYCFSIRAIKALEFMSCSTPAHFIL